MVIQGSLPDQHSANIYKGTENHDIEALAMTPTSPFLEEEPARSTLQPLSIQVTEVGGSMTEGARAGLLRAGLERYQRASQSDGSQLTSKGNGG